MNLRSITTYVLAALIVLILGAVSGWYFFLRGQSQTTTAADSARGYGAGTPFGSANGSAADGGTSLSENAGTVSSRPPQLWHVDKNPVAGMAFIGNATGTPQIEYVERSSGYVFEADPATSAALRLSNTLMPKIYEADITPAGRVIERSLDAAGSITTFLGSVSTGTPDGVATSSVGTLSGNYIAKNITRISIDPVSDGLFYLTTNSAGVASGIRSLPDGTKQKQAFTSVVSGWRPTWLSDGRIILAETAADNVLGYAYELKADGSLAPLVRAIPGLTVLPRAGGALLYGASGNNTLALFARLPNANAVQLSIKTVADKCVWSPGAALIAYCGVPQTLPTEDFLNAWYQGALHTADAIWKVDASAGTAELVYTPDLKTPLDIENPTMDPGGNYIAFVNGADLSLWILRLQK